MTARTITLVATNAGGSVQASVNVTVADPTGGNIVELVGNAMATVDPNPARNAVYAGNLGQAGIIADSGMTYSPDYGTLGALVVTGGGHADYGGNEVYVFPFDTMQWKRINNPSLAINALAPNPSVTPPGSDPVHGELSDGAPIASHTYSLLTAIPGGNKGRLLQFAKNHMSWVGSACSGFAHVCDLETGVWSRFSTNAAPQRFDGMAGEAVCYDASSNRAWAHIRSGAISYLDLATGRHMGAVGTSINGAYIPTCTRVPVNGLMLGLCSAYSDTAAQPWRLSAIDLAAPAAGQRVLNLTGDIIPPARMGAGGFDWDTVGNRGYIYIGNWTGGDGNSKSDNAHVWQVDPPAQGSWITGTWTLTKLTLPSPFPAQLNGVYSRWRYCSGIGKFALVSKTTNKVSLWTPPA